MPYSLKSKYWDISRLPHKRFELYELNFRDGDYGGGLFLLEIPGEDYGGKRIQWLEPVSSNTLISSWGPAIEDMVEDDPNEPLQRKLELIHNWIKHNDCEPGEDDTQVFKNQMEELKSLVQSIRKTS